MRSCSSISRNSTWGLPRARIDCKYRSSTTSPRKRGRGAGIARRRIAKRTRAVASIFPFETEFYQRAGANAQFVGHPLLDYANSELSVVEAREKLGLVPDAPVLGLMPGSRRREVEALYPVMLDAAEEVRRSLPDCQLISPLAPEHPSRILAGSTRG